ncbi:hypothetical protein CASFOL_003482 [Castilleja foliolosa]|uniref:peptidyl-tRNA hydrolase n=1 Tax=Castilleja foliolosa TaxID=1961234 RepID=A0ABD3EKL7_9LAMI
MRIPQGFARRWFRRLSKKDTQTTDDKRKKNNRALEIEELADTFDDFKMVLVVRNDLKMGEGRIAAQCSNATLGLYKKILNRAPKSLSRWEMCGQVKVVVKIESEAHMVVLQERAKSLKLPTHTVIDVGRTQIAPNSRTVMAVFGPAELVDFVTGGLKHCHWPQRNIAMFRHFVAAADADDEFNT